MQSRRLKAIFRNILSFPAFRFFVVTALVLAIVLSCASQNSARVNERAGTGAAVGAGIGLLIGVLSGNPEKAAAGVAVGAAVGASEFAYEGWAQEPGEERLTVKAKVNGDVEMDYYVELAYIDTEISGLETNIWGTSMLGYDVDDSTPRLCNFSIHSESNMQSRLS